jgi:Flp pilus assembly pilin Flp
MQFAISVLTWVASKLKLDSRGQTATEYVMIIMAVALFLVAAAILLQPVLSAAVSAISSWMGAQGPP